jgi:hypothetical protein
MRTTSRKNSLPSVDDQLTDTGISQSEVPEAKYPPYPSLPMRMTCKRVTGFLACSASVGVHQLVVTIEARLEQFPCISWGVSCRAMNIW